jgi:predicted transcriptional regulator YheO
MESVQEDLEYLEHIAKAITSIFGDNCEVVIHDLKDRPYDSTIVSITNGHVTDRHVGDCGTNLGLEVLRGTDADGNRFNYSTQTKSGRLLHSSSIYFKNKKSEVVGAFCINFDVTELVMAEKALGVLTQGILNNNFQHAEDEGTEVFANDVNQLLDEIVKNSIAYVGKPVANMTKEDKIKGLTYLDQKGAFLIKKAGDRIAKYYGLSKYTIYSYLESAK